MSEPSEIVRYTRADRPQVFVFLAAAASAADSARLMRQWDWKYDANPFNRDSEPYVLLWRDAGEIVGMLGALTVRVCIDGAEHVVGHLCDWAVRPDHRGQRMARRMLDRQRPDWPVRFAWQNEISRKLSPGMIGDSSGILRVEPVARPLKVGDVVQHTTGSRLLGHVAAMLTQGPLAGLLTRRATVPGVNVAEINGFDDRFDDFWQRVRRDYRVILVRDQRYLQWRFAQRPDAHYRILVATRGTAVVGYLVLREVEQEGVRRGYLVDFLVAERSTEIFSLLVRHALTSLEQGGAKWLTCRVVVPPFRRALHRLGFVPVVQSAGGYLRTYRPEGGSPDHASGLFVDPANWFVTMGDGDLELSS